MWVREIIAIRGATTCEANTKDAVLRATEELLTALLAANNLTEKDLISIIFTGTPDITAAFPALAARTLGLQEVPLLGAQELAVEGAPKLCVRVLLHAHVALSRHEIKHLYLHGAQVLRPELAVGRASDRELCIAIDGPAGAGKSTVARNLAQELNLRYLDTGAMYRALTWQALVKGIDLQDESALTKLLEASRFALEGASLLTLNGEPLGEEIRSPQVNDAVSRVAQVSAVRQVMVRKQQEIAETCGIVMEGRDIGTEVMPTAPIKIFLVADHAERARRRQLEMQSQGHAALLTEVAEQIKARDDKDSTRAASPLRKAPDAVTIDCTFLSPAEVVQAILRLVWQEAHARI
jgi:cytidylate kinase